MKIYVSLPITGHHIDEVKLRAEEIKESILAESPDSEVITPFDVCPETDKPYSYYMGRDIEVLLCCDTIYLADGWENSKGCRLERAAADIYGIEVLLLKS